MVVHRCTCSSASSSAVSTSIAIRILSSIKRMLLPERSGAFKSLNAIPLTCLTCLPARAKHRIKVSHRRRRVTGKISQSDKLTQTPCFQCPLRECEGLRPLSDEQLELDRKSTRLNSSH